MDRIYMQSLYIISFATFDIPTLIASYIPTMASASDTTCVEPSQLEVYSSEKSGFIAVYPPFQIVGRFSKSRYIYFIIHMDKYNI